MKTRRCFFLLLIFLVVGFAAVSTSLFMNGVIGIASNDDFDVIFTSAIPESGGNASISENGKTITYDTKNLTIVNEEARLNFVVKNTSTQYDAEAVLNCVLDADSLDVQEYITFDYMPNSKFSLKAQESKNGNVAIKLAKAYAGENQSISFTCNIVSNAIEKDTVDIEDKRMNFSVYSWNDVAFLNNNINDTVNVLRDRDIGEVYHSFARENLNNSFTRDTINYLNANGMDVYYLTGKPNFYNKPKDLKNIVDLITNYNSSVRENERMNGLVLDIEPYLDTQYMSNVVEGMQVYANTLEQVYTYAKEKGLKLVNVVPYWYDEAYLDSNDYSSEEKVIIENSIRKIFSNSDRISVMNYYKTYMTNGIRYESLLAQELGVEIESIAEFGKPNSDSILETVTFWGEEKPFEYAIQRWEEINNEYSIVDKFSYHDLSSILELLGKYQEYLLEFVDNDGNVLEVNEFNLKFTDGNVVSIDSVNSVSIPIGKEFSVSIYGYKVLSSEGIREDYDLKKLILTVDKYDKYTLEIYPKLFDGNNYESINAGKIVLKSSLFSEVLETPINEGGYAIVNVFSDTSYEVEVLDSEGNAYTFEYADATNEAGVLKVISTGNKILIPKRFKSNLYIGPNFYVK